jgi:hypothetical protein
MLKKVSAKSIGLVLTEYVPVNPAGDQESCYRVSQMKNTIEWSIGSTLTRKQMIEILRRTPPREVEVIIKEM